VVLINRSLLFIFGTFGQVLNGFYETARMFESGKIFRHLEDLSFLMEVDGAWEGSRKFLFKLHKSFAGRELPSMKAKTYFLWHTNCYFL